MHCTSLIQESLIFTLIHTNSLYFKYIDKFSTTFMPFILSGTLFANGYMFFNDDKPTSSPVYKVNCYEAERKVTATV